MIRRQFACLISTLFLACSSGGDGDPDAGATDTGSPQGTQFGFFIDDSVENLVVEYAGGPLQTTDSNGVFQFALNADVTFSVDDVALGTIRVDRNRITPQEFGAANVNVARFLQSMDISPTTPGIDLTGIDLADDPIEFIAADAAFESDAKVAAALAVSQALGGTGALVTRMAATAALSAGTNQIITQSDLENLVIYPESLGVNEPCVAIFNADLTGENFCQDDIDDDPTDPVSEFTWSVVAPEAVLQFGVDEKATVTKLGTTGNRWHTSILSECASCNPSVETELQTLHRAIPITAADFSGQTLTVTGSDGNVTTAVFNGDGTATFTDTDGTDNALWSVDTDYNVLLVQGTGAPGATELGYDRVFLIDGTVSNGELVVLAAETTDADGNGVADESDFDLLATYDSIEKVTTN